MVSPKVAAVAALFACWCAWEVSGQQRAAAPHLLYPNGLALDSDGGLYISDIGTHLILKLARGTLTVIAGTGAGGLSGDGGPAARAELFAPHGLAVDGAGGLVIADTFNHRVRRIDRSGVITTIAGTGTAGYSGDGGPAAAAAINGPQDIAIDREGNIFIADTYNAVIRRIDRVGIVTTFAGSEPGLGGDGGPATKALINMPSAVAVREDGAVYVSDAGNSRIRRISSGGLIETVVGTGGGSGLGGAGFAGDGGPADQSKAFSAMGLQFDRAGRLYISDTGNNRVRVVRDGVIATVAGSGQIGFGGDGGKATAALLNTPQKIAVAPDGRIFIADRANGRVRMVGADGAISTVAGDGKPPGILTGPDTRH